jgi:hypothetical protein
VAETGGYGFYTLRGKMVAGYGPAQDPAGLEYWTTYVNVDDLDAVVAAVAGSRRHDHHRRYARRYAPKLGDLFRCGPPRRGHRAGN